MAGENWRDKAKRSDQAKQNRVIDVMGINRRGLEKLPAESLDEASFVTPAAERAIVSAILQNPDAIADVVDIVTPDDFLTAPAATIYRAMDQLWTNRVPPNMVTLANELANNDLDIDLAGMLSAVQPWESVYIAYYAKIVASQAQRRRFQAAVMEGVVDLYRDAALEVDAVLASIAQKSVGSITFNAMVEIDPAMQQTIEGVSDEFTGLAARTSVPSGFYELDQMLGGGFDLGELIALAARSSMGKTSLASDFLLSASEYGSAVFFSTEMSTDSVLRRMASRQSGVPLERLRNGTLTGDEFNAFIEAGEELRSRDIFIDDTPGITTDQIELRIQRIQADRRVSLAVFDYLELAGDVLPNGRDDTHARLSMVVDKLKLIARRIDIPILLLSQVARNIDLRQNKVPMMSDMRWTAKLEQTSDKVLMMYIHDYYVSRGFEAYDASREGLCEVHVHKNRNGAVGMVPLGYDPVTFRFFDVTNQRRLV